MKSDGKAAPPNQGHRRIHDFFALAHSARAQLRKINIAHTATSPYQAVLIVAKEVGLFKKTQSRADHRGAITDRTDQPPPMQASSRFIAASRLLIQLMPGAKWICLQSFSAGIRRRRLGGVEPTQSSEPKAAHLAGNCEIFFTTVISVILLQMN
jgi:hypothetical protein